MDDRYRNSEQDFEEDNRTVRTTKEDNNTESSDAEVWKQRKKEEFENDRTVRYSSWMPKTEKKENVTVRLSDAGFEVPKVGEFSGNMIDPVAIVLSDDNHTQMPAQRQKTKATVPVISKPTGWLICVEGPDYGKSFPLKNGVNTIGRSDDMDVVLKKDLAVSRNRHAQIEYLEEKRCFLAETGEQKKIVYINDELLLEPVIMKKNDLLMLGDSSLMLIPCCDEAFSWDEWDAERVKI